jgi:hypothetical protein
MDTYLPAELRELHCAGLMDWRDARATSSEFDSPRTLADSPTLTHPDSMNACADPLWRVF